MKKEKKIDKKIETILRWLKEEEEWWYPSGRSIFWSSFKEYALCLGYDVLIGGIIKTDFEEMVKRSKSFWFWHKGVGEKKLLLLVERKIREVKDKIEKKENLVVNRESMLMWKKILEELKN